MIAETCLMWISMQKQFNLTSKPCYSIKYSCNNIPNYTEDTKNEYVLLDSSSISILQASGDHGMYKGDKGYSSSGMESYPDSELLIEDWLLSFMMIGLT